VRQRTATKAPLRHCLNDGAPTRANDRPSTSGIIAVTPSRTLRAGTPLTLGRFFLGLALVALLPVPSEASPAQPALQVRSGASAQGAKLATVKPGEPAQTSAIDDSSAQGSCERSRKRFWVEGEGWIVRRVGTCR